MCCLSLIIDITDTMLSVYFDFVFIFWFCVYFLLVCLWHVFRLHQIVFVSDILLNSLYLQNGLRLRIIQRPAESNKIGTKVKTAFKMRSEDSATKRQSASRRGSRLHDL